MSAGLQFRKLDLHIHTPASEDYKDKCAKPRDIVDAALRKGLSAIAITDHQTGESIDAIKNAARETGLTVFPGVELLVSGGERGVHVIALFDVDKDSQHVEQFLNTIKIYKQRGKRTLAADLTVSQVADVLEQYDDTALLLLPHCHSSKGVTGDIKGETRTKIFELPRKCLLGAEANESDFLSEEKKQKHTRVIDCFDGHNPDYHKRKLGVYQASDAHSLAEIGTTPTFFKVDEPLSIEDIRQSLIDRETRIRQTYEYKTAVYPRIESLKVNSGFLADQQINFHDGLNSLLGAKGAGKSLVIEFLRFALNQSPHNPELLEDHTSKLEKCLKSHGTVVVVIGDESGKRYQITRTYDPSEDHPLEVIELGDKSLKELEIAHLFPVLFLSQNEVIKLAEDRSGASQREFIDRFFDFYRYQEKIEKLKVDLSNEDKRFADALKAHLASVELKKQLNGLKEEIEKVGRQISNPVFATYAKREKIGRAIANQATFVQALVDDLKEDKLQYIDLSTPATGDTEVDSDPGVRRATNEAKGAGQSIITAFDGNIKAIQERLKSINAEHQSWQAQVKSVKDQYDDVVRQAGGTQVSLDDRRKRLNTDIAKIETSLAKYDSKAKQITAITTKRNETIDKLDQAYKDYYQARKARCDYFTANSFGTLEVTIKEREDNTNFKNNLLALKRGTWLKEDDIEKISMAVSPREFVENLMRYEWSGRSKKVLLESIASQSALRVENVEKLAEHLLSEHPYETILSLLHTSVPKDVPSIRYKVGTRFKDLQDLSVGQKAVALLIIALSDGSFPIVIDQPEDSLDLKTIWDDLCKKLRGSKDQRQFIFTTHNSSVAVASDTDKFTILRADADKGEALYSGSLNRRDVRQEVVDYLEGGDIAYGQKRQKYNK